MTETSTAIRVQPAAADADPGPDTAPLHQTSASLSQPSAGPSTRHGSKASGSTGDKLRKPAAIALTLIIILSIVYSAQLSTSARSAQHTTAVAAATSWPHQLQNQPKASAASDPGASLAALQRGVAGGPPWCSYGTLPGSWVTSPTTAPGSHWHVLEERCQLHNLLSTYDGSDTAMPRNKSDMDPNVIRILDPGEKMKQEEQEEAGHAGGEHGGHGPAPASASIMFIGDSIDRYILSYLCTHIGGQVRAVVLREVQPDGSDPCSSAEGQAAVGPAAAAVPRSLRRRSPTSAAPLQGGAAGAAAEVSVSPGCIINTCTSPSGRLRLLATYFPGVHPTGPYHKERKLGFRARINQAATVWRSYSNSPPDIVVVSSMLWDLARMYAFEPDLLLGPDLDLAVLESWMLNFTEVVNYARKEVPKAGMFVYHTMMLPRHDAAGVMEKAYLGRATFVRQLNAAGRHIAARLGMEIMDFQAIASRFQEGQTYLQDLIHPGPEVGLELANILLNYVHQLKAAIPDS